MTLHGKNFIGAELSANGTKTFFAADASTGSQLEPPFHEVAEAELAQAMLAATAAFAVFSKTSGEMRAQLLETIALEIEALGDELIDRASQETGLPRARLTGERGRTTGQLRMFARLVRDGSYVDARIDHALPDRTPLPRPDIRRMLIPIGPVVVFGASNFPLAFSTAGGDTASALAVGNPAVVKGHPAHPGTSELVGGAIQRAVAALHLPAGIFSHLNSASPEVSLALVGHPATKAVAFTGSGRVGRILLEAGARRPEPIPVYVEMGSINPVFVLPSSVSERADALAAGLAASINLGVGQFCTCPGVIVGLDSEAFRSFASTLKAAFTNAPAGTMLHTGILREYERSVEDRCTSSGVVATRSLDGADAGASATMQARPTLFETAAKDWLAHPELSEEIFGPAAVLVYARDQAELLAVAASLPGVLTATVHASADELSEQSDLLHILEAKCGRLIFNGYPTGVEVCDAMQHGGPFPATGDAKFTSVGTAAVLRFLRPIAYQDLPQNLLPEALQDEGTAGMMRMVDGKYTVTPNASQSTAF